LKKKSQKGELTRMAVPGLT